MSVQLEQIGKMKIESDSKGGSLSFDKGLSKKDSPLGDRLRKIRPQTKSFFEIIDHPIGSNRQMDFDSELINFGTVKREETSKSLSSKGSSNTRTSQMTEDSGMNATNKRRSTRCKILSVFISSDESEEENEVVNEDMKQGSANNRKLSNRKEKNSSKSKTPNPMNYSSDEDVDTPRTPKRGRPKKQSTVTEDHKDIVILNDADLEENPPRLMKKRGKPKKQSTVTEDHKDIVILNDADLEENPPRLMKKRGRPKKQSTVTEDHKDIVILNDADLEENPPRLMKNGGRHKKQRTVTEDPKHNVSLNDNDLEENPGSPVRKGGRPKKLRTINTDDDCKYNESIDDTNREENSLTDLERTRDIVENGSVRQSGDHSDNDDESDELFSFVIEQAQSDYMKLKNSDLTKNTLTVTEKYMKTVAGFISPQFTSKQNEEYPAVTGVQNSLSDSLGVGYMKIEGNTIRPPEVSKERRMIYWILKGSVKVKSAGGDYPKLDSSGEVTNYLYGKKLDQGTCIVVPKMTPFTFENWDSTEADLGFCIIKDADEEE